MLRLILRGVGLFILILLLAPADFSKGSADETDPYVKTTGDTPAAAPSGTSAPVPSAQSSASDKKSSSGGENAAPLFDPMLATTGTIGLFTLETADMLPKRAFAVSAFGNKFSRMPGSVTILQFGVDLSYGITDNLNFYGVFDPHGHVHVGCPGQLSLNSAPLSTCVPIAPGPPAPGTFFPTFFGEAAGYVEDYPFAAGNTGGVGDITLGLKYAFLSEREGAPVSFSIRNDLIISTQTDATKLVANGTQGSPLSDLVSLALSKQWSNALTTTFNFGYMFVRAPRDNQAQPLFDMSDQVKIGVGFLMFPGKRFQPLAEYSGVVFVTAPATPPNTSFGARDPVEAIWGLRVYPWKHLAFDVGYRRMINLWDLNDRSGFLVRVGGAYWPEKALPANHPPTVSCTVDKSMVRLDSRDAVMVSCTGADPDNDPLTYTWASTGGKVDGNGPRVRWLSAGTPLGSYTITAKVDDGRGGFASSAVIVSVAP